MMVMPTRKSTYYVIVLLLLLLLLMVSPEMAIHSKLITDPRWRAQSLMKVRGTSRPIIKRSVRDFNSLAVRELRLVIVGLPF